MLNIGIVGRNHGLKHLKNIQHYHSDKALITALTYKNPIKQSNLKGNIKTYHCYKTMINEENLDALILAGPHNMTLEIIEHSAKKIKFYLIEKPVANNSSEIIKIKNILQKHNCIALIGHHRRFSPRLQALKRIIDSGTIGNVISFDSIWCIKKNDTYYNNHETNWRIHPSQGGGPLAINGIHEIDTIRFLFGEIILTKAILGQSTRRLATEENITAIFKFKNEIIGSLLISDNTPSPFSYEKTMNENSSFPSINVDYLKIFGDKGSISFPSLTIYPYEGSGDWLSLFSTSSIEPNLMCEDPLKLEMDHFLKIIEGKDTPLINIDDALKNMIIIDQIKQEIDYESSDL